MLFNMGRLVVTRGVNDLVGNNNKFAIHAHESLERHGCADWGDLCDEDRVSNELALQNGERLFSVYKPVGHPVIWFITEWDRSVTTVLFPDEY